MIKQNISADEVIDILNDCIKNYDQNAMQELINARVLCNEKMANHPTIQCEKYHDKKNFTVGLLGILNGLFGIDEETGFGIITAYFEDAPDGSNRTVLIRFEKTKITLLRQYFSGVRNEQR